MMKKNKRKMQWMAAIMSFCMMVGLPLPAFAEAAQEAAAEEAKNQPVLLTDKLTETETYWQNADGTITYESNLEPIRYQDEEGHWHEIENDIVQVDKSEKSTDVFKNDGYDYRSESSKAWVLLDEDIRSSAPIKVAMEGLSLTIKPVWPTEALEEEPLVEEEPQAEPTQAPAEEQESNENQQEPSEDAAQPSPTLAVEMAPQAARLNLPMAEQQEPLPESRISFVEKTEEQQGKAKARSRAAAPTADPYTYSTEKEYVAVEYSNVFEEGTALRLQPNNAGFKEDIVLNERPQNDVFSFEVSVTGAVLELVAEDGIVLIKGEDDGEILGYIPQPFMTDASEQEEGEKISFDIGVELENLGQGQYRYTLMPSDEFLDAEDTVYPVKIDPSVTVSGAKTTQDTYVASSLPDRNYYTDQYLKVGKDSSGVKFRSIIRFDLPAGLDKAIITDAKMKTYQSYNGTSAPVFGLYRALIPWTSNNLFWDNVNKHLTTDGPYAQGTVTGVGWYTWPITNMARKWSLDGNYGMVIKSEVENSNKYKRFYSSDASSNKPVFEMTYQPIATNISVSAQSGGNNTSKGSITVDYSPCTAGVEGRLVLNGQEVYPQSNGHHVFSNLPSGVDHKIKMHYYTDYGVSVYSEEKTVKIPDNSPPVFDGFGQASIDSNGQVALSFHPAVKPGSIDYVMFPTWTASGGQDDLIWHGAVNEGNGTWSFVVKASDHKNESGRYLTHLYGVPPNSGQVVFAHFQEVMMGSMPEIVKGDILDNSVVCRDAEAVRLSDTSYKVTAYGVQKKGQISKYEIYWSEAGSTEKHLLETVGGDEYQLVSRTYDPEAKGLPSGKSIYFSIKAFDINGNYTTMELPTNAVDIPNYIPPQRPSALSVTNAAGESYSYDQTPVFGVQNSAHIQWQVEKAAGSAYDIAHIQYKLDQGAWQTIDPAQMTDAVASIKQNGFAVPLADATEGTHTISIRGVDNNSAHPLSGPERSIQVSKDTTAPVISAVYPVRDGTPPVWHLEDTVTVTNVQDDNFKQLEAYIGVKLPWDLPGLPAVFTPVPVTYAKDAGGNDTWPATIPLAGQELTNQPYMLRLVAKDTAGNQSTEDTVFNLVVSEGTQVHHKQMVLQYGQSEDGRYLVNDRTCEFVFDTIEENAAFPAGATAKLFIDGREAETAAALENGRVTFTADILSDANAAVFKEGTVQTLYAVVYGAQGDVLMTSQTSFTRTDTISMTQDSFESLDGFALKDGKLVAAAPAAGNSFTIKGVESGYGLLDSVKIEPIEGLPENVKFEVSFYDGVQYGDPTVIQAGETARYDYQAGSEDTSPYGYKIKGYIESAEGLTAPLEIAGLAVTPTYFGATDQIHTSLVPPPEHLSAQPLVNYTTWLRWDELAPAPASDPTDTPLSTITYDVYRQAQGTETAERIASDLTAPYYYDYNLSYGQTFEYWVVKKMPFTVGEDTRIAQSAPSDRVTATMVEQGEVDKYLGLQDYWSYMTADMGNGTGYINTASGNLAYQKTDFANTAPLLASVMRRTFNSQATSDSALGKGWDYSFNTNLLIEAGHDAYGQPVDAALLLKDGDGTVHRYEKQADGTYKAPDGVFMTLEKLEDGRFKAIRSDDIVYTFNQSMFIESFAEPNGNQLLFKYDDKGRLVYVMHSQYADEGFAENEKQYVEFVYGASPHDMDKLIQANSVYGTENGKRVQQSYVYDYYDDETKDDYGMLKSVRTSVQRPLKVLSQNEDGTESVSDSQETVTMQESYEYEYTQDAEGGKKLSKLNIVTPSNAVASAAGTKQSTLALDGTGRVTRFTNANGDTSTLAYANVDDTHQKTTVTNTVDGAPLGDTSYITDGAKHGVVTQTIAVNGKKTYFENYTDTLKAQTIRTYQDAAETRPVAYALTYDALGNAVTVLAPDGVLTTNTYAEGKDWLTSQTVSRNGTVLNKLVNTYDDKGNLLTTQTAVSDPTAFSDTKTTSYTYNAQGLMTGQTAWNGQQTSYAYDKYGRLSESTVSGSGISQTTRMAYDAYNNPATTTAKRGSKDITTTTLYDSMGYLLKTTDPTGLEESYRYNANGLQTEQLTMGYAGNGNFVEAKKTTVQYDEINRAATTTLPNGTVQTQNVSATAGLITTNTASQGADGVARSTVRQTAADGSYQIETSQGLGTKTYYDYIGNMSKVTQIHNGTEERGVNATYDVMGRVVHTWDDTNSVESYTDYDALGNVEKEWTYVKTEGETRKYTVKAYTHDLEGRVTSVREYTDLQPKGEITADTPSQLTEYIYDQSAEGGLYKNTVTDAEGGVTETYLNQMGQTVREVQKGRNADKQIVTVCMYDGYGRQTEVKQGDQHSQTTKQSYEYDGYDRVKTQRTNGSTYTEVGYDHFGRRNEMVDHTDSTSIRSAWVYDKNDQATYVMQDGKIMGFGYNSQGEMTAVRYSAGNTMEIEGAVRTILYDYDGLGRLTAVKSGVVDTNSESLDATNVKTVKEYGYAENGDLVTSREYLEFDTKADKQGISLEQSYVYDAVGRPTEAAYKQGEAMKERYTQAYDGRNYIVENSYTDGYEATAKTLNRTYEYDAIGRLKRNSVSSSEKSKTTAYAYDKVGNRLYQTVNDGTKTVTTKYSYNGLGQLTETQKGLGSAESVTNWLNENVYTYDVNGNQIGIQVYDINDEITQSEKVGDVRYSYDEANQLIKTERKLDSDASWTEQSRNVYNGEGMRIRQYEDGKDWAKQYFYVGGALTITTDGTNENFVKSENIIDPSGTILAARKEAKEGESIEGNQYWVYHYDAQGSVTNIVGTKDGALYRAEENVYDAFGNEETDVKQSTSSVQNDIKFTGASLDNSGTYYLGSRHYDPNTGRFLQQDTFKGDAYSPWTQNLYTYTSNNPVNYTDPTGHLLKELGQIFGGFFDFILGGKTNFAKTGKKIGAAVDKALGLPSLKTVLQSSKTKASSKPRNTKAADGTLNVPVYIMETVNVTNEEDAKNIIRESFDMLTKASGGSTIFQVNFVNSAENASFVYNIRGSWNVGDNSGSNYYSMPDRIDLSFDSISINIGTQTDLLKAKQADQFAVIEETMHMAGMREEHYSGHSQKALENCPYKGTFLAYDNKYKGNGPNKQMADTIEYYVTTGNYNYKYCTHPHNWN